MTQHSPTPAARACRLATPLSIGLLILLAACGGSSGGGGGETPQAAPTKPLIWGVGAWGVNEWSATATPARIAPDPTQPTLPESNPLDQLTEIAR